MRCLQPIEQFHAVGLVAQEHLAEVDVALDESGQERVTGGLEHRDAARGAELLRGDAGDAALFHQQIAAQDLAARVHA